MRVTNRVPRRWPRWIRLLLPTLLIGIAVTAVSCQPGSGAGRPVESAEKRIPVTTFAACSGGDDTAPWPTLSRR